MENLKNSLSTYIFGAYGAEESSSNVPEINTPLKGMSTPSTLKEASSANTEEFMIKFHCSSKGKAI